jgi:hypothetical protein
MATGLGRWKNNHLHCRSAQLDCIPPPPLLSLFLPPLSLFLSITENMPSGHHSITAQSHYNERYVMRGGGIGQRPLMPRTAVKMQTCIARLFMDNGMLDKT